MRIRLIHLPLELPEHDAPRGPFINIMPVGLLALADRLDRDGHDVEVVHAGIEKRLDPHFDIAAELRTHPVDLVGFALHWHYQLGPVAAAVEAIRAAGLDLPIVLGGMTATAFAREIVEHWTGVDYVIRGEAEEPLAQLARALCTSPAALDEVPNLTRRAHGRPAASPTTYVADQRAFDALEFCRLELLRHASHYNSQFAADLGGFSHERMFYLGIGRGCSVDCAFCSGGRTAHSTLAGRHCVVFRSHERVLADIRRLLGHGISTACICFDPPPTSEEYFIGLFERIADAGLDLSMVFECYGAPSTSFVSSFARAFRQRGSRLSFSPTVGDEALRKRILGHAYTNTELERVLEDCSRFGIETTLYFATLPQESRDQLERSLAWQQDLVRRFGCRLIHAPIELEPQAPWSVVPSSFSLKHARHGFDDYIRRHRSGTTLGVRYSQELGYDFDDIDARVVRIQSAFVDPARELSRAMGWCGQSSVDRYLLVGPGRLPESLRLAGMYRARPYVAFLPEDYDPHDWALLGQVADALGPNARLAVIAPASVKHVAWDGARHARAAGSKDTLAVLHLRDANAARAALLGDRRPVLAGNVVVAEQCRWSDGVCPARQARMLAVGADGAVRTCLSCPPLVAVSADAVAGQLAMLAREAEERRGCAECPVASACAKCLFTGRIAERAYCDIRRALGPGGAGGFSETGPGSGAAIGWDG